MNVVRCRHTFAHRGPLCPARSDVPHLPAKKPIPPDGDTSAKRLIFRPILPNDRTNKDWTAIAWPTNIQSRTPDGKFGPAKIMNGWNDCWFLAALAAVANDPDGQQILAESIKKVNGGYDVTFKGLPDNNVFISDAELQKLLETQGGDADTRLMELAAYRFFSRESGSYKSLYITTFMKEGRNQEEAEQCFQIWCSRFAIQDPLTYNPMRYGSSTIVAFFMFTGRYPGILDADGSPIQKRDVMRFLNQYVINDRDGTPFAIIGVENPLGDSDGCQDLVIDWDVIRTEITSNGTVDPQQRIFLNALNKWLATRSMDDLLALMSAAGNMELGHINPEEFVYALAYHQFNMNQDHINLLRSGVQEVLAGGSGYIGFPGQHSGTIDGINEAAGSFTYSEPNNPTLVHTGELSDLIQAIRFSNIRLAAVEPTRGQDEAESSHAGEQRGRHLRQIHDQVVGDRKIDPAESGPIANLMEMEDGAFWQVYDSDKNGVIEGGELKAVKLRVDRWVDHFKLTPIW